MNGMKYDNLAERNCLLCLDTEVQKMWQVVVTIIQVVIEAPYIVKKL